MKIKAILVAALFSGLLFMPSLASAQGQTSSGVLTVSAELASSINLTFATDTNGVVLTGTGTNAATLDFGTVSRFSTPITNVTQANGATSFTLSTPFDISVLKSNVTSATYSLTAQLQTVDAVNAWTIDTIAIGTNPTAPTSLTVTGAYATNAPHTLVLTVPFSEGAATVTNTINFQATAN
jgi:hypothetical protein